MRWSESAGRQTAEIYRRILEQPFLRELGEGTLSPGRFHFYLRQDAFYLKELKQVLHLLALRLEDPEEVNCLKDFVSETVEAEEELRRMLLQEAPFSDASPCPQESSSLRVNNGANDRANNSERTGCTETAEPSPACLLYTGFLYTRAYGDSLETALAAVLPCFWFYQKLGEDLSSKLERVQQHLYRSWIESYSSPDFRASAEKMRRICDHRAEAGSEETRREMTRVFKTAARIEEYFWKSAYNRETWEPEEN